MLILLLLLVNFNQLPIQTNLLMQFLLLHHLFYHPTYRTLLVSVHKSPGMVEKSNTIT